MSPRNKQYKKEVDMLPKGKPFRSDDPQDPNSALSHLVLPHRIISTGLLNLTDRRKKRMMFP